MAAGENHFEPLVRDDVRFIVAALVIHVGEVGDQSPGVAFSGICKIVAAIKTPVRLPGTGLAHFEDLPLLLVTQSRVQPVISNVGAL